MKVMKAFKIVEGIRKQSSPITFIIFITFIFSCQTQAQVDRPVDRILAKLEDQIVLESELEKMYLNLQQEGQITTNDNTFERKCELLEFLITNQLMLAVAHRDSVKIAP